LAAGLPEPFIMANRKAGTAKASVKRRSLNVGSGSGGTVGGNEQDPQRRLGDFTGAGEHARKGARRTGIVGQTTKTFRANKKGR
jgi:hypothetical protein